MKLYGIPTCDSVRKARRILDQRGAHYQYIDLRQNPPDDALLRDWFARFGSALVNKRSTTYREHKAAVLAAEAAGDDALIALKKAPHRALFLLLERTQTAATSTASRLPASLLCCASSVK